MADESINMTNKTRSGAVSDKKSFDQSTHPDVETNDSIAVGDTTMASGTARAQAMRLTFGKHGLVIVWIGLILMLIVYQFDNALMYNYRQYAASNFNNVAGLSTLAVAGNIIFAVFKPPIAKLSTVIGRGESYIFCIVCYLLGYILCASSDSFGTYAGGFVFANIGQTGANVLNDIVISDISSMRWRGFAISASFFPFLITPWISGFIVQDVVKPGGIGWRWGIGMFAIIMPIVASWLIGSLLYYQRRAKRQHLYESPKLTIREFCSQLDLGGAILLAGGFAMFLIPFSLAGSTPSNWKTGWIIALIVLGFAVLVGMIFYEKYVPANPIVPARYLRNITVVLCCLMGLLDTFGFQATHTYLYTWAVVVHDMGPRDATFLNYTNGVWQAAIGFVGGLIMYKTRRYKWLMVAGAAIKLLAYGLMIRLRGANNSYAELFIVQSVQGWGSGLIEIIIIVAAQNVVPHTEMPQVTALVLLFTFVGAAVGNAVAGGIYTGTFKPRLRHYLGSSASEQLIDSVYDSITKGIPSTGSAERVAVDLAYSDVLRYITYTAVGTSVIVLIFSVFVPDKKLPETIDPFAQRAEEGQEDDAKEPVAAEQVEQRRKWWR